MFFSTKWTYYLCFFMQFLRKMCSTKKRVLQYERYHYEAVWMPAFMYHTLSVMTTDYGVQIHRHKLWRDS
jgi:hypothetical protein